MARWWVGLVFLATLCGCIAEGPERPLPSVAPARPAPTASTSTSPTPAPTGIDPSIGPAPTTDPTATPTLPDDDLRRSAKTDKDGVRVSIVLERNPMPVGEPTWVTTRVTNTGTDDLIWFHDGCAITVGVSGKLRDVRWTLGDPLPDPAGAWKPFLTDGHGANVDRVTVYFTPAAHVGRGSIGCADIGITDRIPPGRTIEQRAQWNGLAYEQLIPPPTSEIDLVGTLRYYWRASDGEDPGDITSRTIDVHLTAWIQGDGVARLGPWEAIDAALRDPRLLLALGDRQPGNGNSPLLRFDPSTGVYEIGIVQSGNLPVPRAIYAQIDAQSGAVVGLVERDWSYAVEGNP